MKKQNIETVKTEGAVSAKPEPTKIEAPVEKFSATREVQPVAATVSPATEQEYKPKKVSRKSVLKQEVVAAIASGRDGGGGVIPTAGIGGTNLGSYSGNEGTMAGSLSGTPIADAPSRSGSRFGKKLDASARKVDTMIAEQIVLGFEESKPLSESRDQVQGYNGTYRNETMRLQKNQGAVPGSVRFARSVDEIFRDQIYYVHGQVVKQSGRDYGDYPTQTVDLSSNTNVLQARGGSRGNFIPRKLNVTINASNLVSSYTYSVDDVSITEADSTVVNAAASHALTHVNSVELARQSIDSKAGDEQLENWSPLARAVHEPSRVLSYLKDIEQDTGSVIATAYRKLAHALSYQINKAGKDGTHTKRPFREMLNTNFGFTTSSVTFENGGNGSIVDDEASYALGGPNLMLELFDSLPKYNSKADYLLQPRSFKMHLDNAKGSLGIFRTNPSFIKAMQNMDVFSTIDRDYDPTLPVCVSDFVSLVSPLNWNNEFTVNSLDGSGNPLGATGVSYAYSDVRNKYITTTNHPLLKGIYDFILQNAVKFRKVITGSSESNSVFTIEIPINYSLTAITSWELLVLASIQFIERARIDSLREVLDYERAHGYPFTDLVKLSDVDVTGSKNFTFISHQEPLKVGRMKAATALTWTMPELFWAQDEKSAFSGQDFEYVLPWYFNETQFSFANTGASTFEPLQATMSWPSSRDGVRFAPLDSIYSLTERQARLSLDRMVRPMFTSRTGANNSVYKYDMTSDGIPSHVMTAAEMTISNFLKTPREVGMFIVAPYGYASPKAYVNADFSPTRVWGNRFKAVTEFFGGRSSYRLRSYFGAGLESVLPVAGDDKLAAATLINVNRGLNFQQNWLMFFAAEQEIANYVNADIGLLFSATDLFDSSDEVITGKSKFRPFFNGYVDVNNAQAQKTGADYEVIGLQKYLWTRINVLPFAINPFDLGFKADSIGEDTTGYDPFDILYIMNLVGFRASDFTEDIYNKTQRIDTEKLLYTTDEFVMASPIIE